MSQQSQVSSYIQQQRDRLLQDIARVGDTVHEARGRYIGEADRLQAAMSGLSAHVDRICDQASARTLQNAGRAAWPAALSLAAPFGPGAAQFGVWLAVLLVPMLFALRLGMTPTTGLVFIAAVYAGMVHWGRGREARRTSKAERDAIEAFRGLKVLLAIFHSQPSGSAEFPYKVTLGSLDDEECGEIKQYRIDQKQHGPQFGATFLAFGSEAGKVRLLGRLAHDGFAASAIPLDDLEQDSRWAVWGPLASEAAQACPPEVAARARAFVDAQGRVLEERSRQRLLEKRLETLRTMEASWSDVALPVQTLDDILRLVDSFRSGRPIKGILLHGPPGTGKTLIARKLARHSGCHFIDVGVADLKSEHIGGSGPKVRQTWERARKDAPTILFIDECESVFASRGSSQSDSFGAELVQTFLSEWDGFNQSSGQVLVIGATNRHELLDAAIMSRFTESIRIGLPDAACRQRILASELAKAGLHFEPTDEMARETAGMSGRDIHTLVSKIVSRHPQGDVTGEQFAEEVRRLRGKQSTAVERLSWDDLVLPAATLAEFKSLGRELVHAEELRGLGVDVPRGILLYGPPGTGKTQLARVLASESGLAFIAATSSDLKAGYVGQSGGLVRQLFDRARGQAPCILFLDEIDAIAPTRGAGDSFTNEIVAQLLQELDGVATRKGQVFLLAATNLPHGIDPALHSRFERRIEIRLPDEGARAGILALQLSGKPVDFDIAAACGGLAARTAGMSGRDLQSLANNATRRALQRAIDEHGDPLRLRLKLADLDAALADATPAPSTT